MGTKEEQYAASLDEEGRSKFEIVTEIVEILRKNGIEYWLFAKPSDEIGSDKWLRSNYFPHVKGDVSEKTLEFAKTHLDNLAMSVLTVFMSVAKSAGVEEDDLFLQSVKMMIGGFNNIVEMNDVEDEDGTE